MTYTAFWGGRSGDARWPFSSAPVAVDDRRMHFELLEVRPNWCDQNIINRKALMNTLWQLHPEYAMSYNVQEQSGGHDILGLVMDSFGAEVSLQGSLQNMISITPGAGFDYLNLR